MEIEAGGGGIEQILVEFGRIKRITAVFLPLSTRSCSSCSNLAILRSLSIRAYNCVRCVAVLWE